MVQLSPTAGSNNSPFTVPAGKQLVVTGVDLILYSNLTSPIYMRLNVPTGRAPGPYVYEDFNQIGPGMQQFSFPQGIVYPAGSSVIFDNNPGNASAEVVVRGYLTSM